MEEIPKITDETKTEEKAQFSEVIKEKKESPAPTKKYGKVNKWTIASYFLFLLLIASLFTYGFSVRSFVLTGSKDAVAKRTIDYINKNLLPQGSTASLVSISKKPNGLYNLKFKIGEQEVDSYLSGDGSLLFPQVIDLKAVVAANPDKGNSDPKEIPKTEKPDAKLFVMSYCPYGNQAEDAMMPVIDLLKDKFNITLNYITSKSGDSYKSLHGDNELNEDIREMCVQKYEKDKFWSFIKEMNAKTTLNDAAEKWEEIAKGLGIDVNKIKTCVTNEASVLLDADIELMKKYSVSGSPTLVINDTVYSGSRTSNGYKDGICSGFQTPLEECNTQLSGDTGSTATGGGCGGN